MVLQNWLFPVRHKLQKECSQKLEIPLLVILCHRKHFIQFVWRFLQLRSFQDWWKNAKQFVQIHSTSFPIISLISLLFSKQSVWQSHILPSPSIFKIFLFSMWWFPSSETLEVTRSYKRFGLVCSFSFHMFLYFMLSFLCSSWLFHFLTCQFFVIWIWFFWINTIE